MTDPISFTSASPRFSLPFLFAAQAQREFYVNEALARLDALLHPVVQGIANDPPLSPQEGECWIVGPDPTGEWAGHPDAIATMQSGNWLLIEATTGLQVYNQSSTQCARYDSGWLSASTPANPTGGSVQDLEARTAISGLIAALVSAGILPSA